MAYRRCISVRAALFARTSTSSFGYFSRENDRDKPKEFRSNIQEYLTQSRSLGSTVKSVSWRYGGSIFREGSGLWMNRYMSTSVVEAVAEMSEVAVAAADSALPVAATQYFIGGVHSFTGLNWWASIALTTLLFSGATIPPLIYSSKFLIKILSRVPGLIELRAKYQAGDPSAKKLILLKLLEGLFKHVCNAPLSSIPFFASMIGVQGSFILYYLAITNMAEKVPSFKNGGALWFTDLTTPDAMYILPFLTALTIWPSKYVLKRKFRPGYRDVGDVLLYGAVLSILDFPQALYCHWITSNVFMCCFVYILRIPGVMKAVFRIPRVGKTDTRAIK